MVEPDADRDPFELLAAEFTDRCRRGQRPSVDEYARNHPEFADEIRALFPTIAAIEQVKSAGPRQSGGGPIRGGLSLDRLGDFRIIRELGRGGMGIVYEAEQESLGRRVALKVLPRPLLLDPKQLERFEREARTAARLHHTNIVPIFGVGVHEGYHYFVMQYIRGVGLDVVLSELRRTLGVTGVGAAATASPSPSGGSRRRIDVLSMARALARDASSHSPRPATDPRVPSATSNPPSGDSHARCDAGPAPEDESRSDAAATPCVGPAYWRSIASMVLQVADALAYAHGQGTLHRDIKPGNLLIDAEGMVWVADFGLAKALDHDGSSHTGGVSGTWRYMAPEQYDGAADARSDVYSLGLTLYELATLRPAFVETSRTALVNAITRGTLEPPRQRCPDMPRDIETVILKSIAREPDARYASASALATDLRRFLEDRPILARRATIPERLWRWSRRNPALAALSGTAVTLLIAIAAIATTAYVHTSRANVQVRRALAGEQKQRQKSEATTDLALEALDAIFAEFAPSNAASLATSYAESSDTPSVTVPLQPALSTETAALLEHMLEFYVRLAQQEGDAPAIRRKMAAANQRIGDIHQRLGNFEDAAAAYSKALTLYTELDEGPPSSPNVHVEIARIHNELGSLFVAQDRGAEGQEEFSLAAAALETASASGQVSPESNFELARTYFLLGRDPRPPVPPRGPGRPPQPQGEPAPPRFGPGRRLGPGMSPPELHRRGEYVRDAISILAKLCAAHPNTPGYRLLLARCYRELHPDPLAPARSPASNPRAQAVEILEQLVHDFPAVPEYRYELGEAYATLDEERGPNAVDPQTTEQHMRAALRITEKLTAERPNVPAYELSLARMYHKLGNELWLAGRLDEAEGTFRHAVALQAALARRFPEIGPYAVGQVVYQLSLADLLSRQNRLQGARELLESSVAALDNEVCQSLGRAYVYDLSERCYRRLSTVLGQLGEHELATAAAERADESRQALRDWRPSAPGVELPPRSGPR